MLQNTEAQRERKLFPCLNIDLFILLHLQLICSFLRCIQMWNPTWILSSLHTAFQPQPVSFSCLPSMPSFINSFQRWPSMSVVGFWYLSRATVSSKLVHYWTEEHLYAKCQRTCLQRIREQTLPVLWRIYCLLQHPILSLRLKSRRLQPARGQAWPCACPAIFTVSWPAFAFSPLFRSIQFLWTEHLISSTRLYNYIKEN